MSSREQFEDWVRSEWPKAPLLKYNGGDYRSETVQQSWTAWQASRQALVVKLPEEYVLPPATDYDTLTAACRQQDREAIEAAGVRVKP